MEGDGRVVGVMTSTIEYVNLKLNRSNTINEHSHKYLSALTNLWIHIHVFPRYVGNL